MALSKKKSRPIVVENKRYRWRFYEDSGYNVVTVQNEAGDGPALQVYIPWKHSGTPLISLEPPVTPLTVRNFIVEAWKLGWEGDDSPRLMQLDLDAEGALLLKQM